MARSRPSDGPVSGDHARWAQRHQLPLYFVLAFLFSWAAWPLVALNPDSSPLVTFGPLLAAITVGAAAGGLRRVGRLLAS